MTNKNKTTRTEVAYAITYIELHPGNHHVSGIAEWLNTDEKQLKNKLYANSRRKTGGHVKHLGDGWFTAD